MLSAYVSFTMSTSIKLPPQLFIACFLVSNLWLWPWHRTKSRSGQEYSTVHRQCFESLQESSYVSRWNVFNPVSQCLILQNTKESKAQNTTSSLGTARAARVHMVHCGNVLYCTTTSTEKERHLNTSSSCRKGQLRDLHFIILSYWVLCSDAIVQSKFAQHCTLQRVR